MWSALNSQTSQSIISFGTVNLEGEWCRLALRFGGPLTGPPNAEVWSSSGSSHDPDLEVVCRSAEWRALERAFGNGLRYQHRNRLNEQ